MDVVVLWHGWHVTLLLIVPMVPRRGWHVSLLSVLGKASWKGWVWWRFGESSKTLANKTNHQDVVLDERRNKGMRPKSVTDAGNSESARGQRGHSNS